jgi:hypothetical protein
MPYARAFVDARRADPGAPPPRNAGRGRPRRPCARLARISIGATHSNGGTLDAPNLLQESKARRLQTHPTHGAYSGGAPQGPTVIEKLDFFVRFWELKARHASVGEPLRPSEQIELLSLMQLVTRDLHVPRPGPASRKRGALGAELIGEGVIQKIELRMVSAAAIIATGSAAMPVGERVVVRAADAVRGVEYVLPCVVAWVHAGSHHTMALVLDGIPTRKSFTSPPDSLGRNALAIGRQERMVG